MSLHPDFLARPITHRALHDVTDGRPENSRAAIAAAITGGYGIEIDLQLTADGQAVVFHDYDLKRLTGQTGPVRGRTAAELAEIPLLGGSEGIPTLAEVLTLVDGRVPVLVELKDQDGALGPDVGPLEQATARAASGYKGPIAFMSFNPHSMVALADIMPDRTRGLTTGDFTEEKWPNVPVDRLERLSDIPDIAASGAEFISHFARELDHPRVAELKAQGVPILCWTIRSPEAEALARQIADNVTFERYRAG